MQPVLLPLHSLDETLQVTRDRIAQDMLARPDAYAYDPGIALAALRHELATTNCEVVAFWVSAIQLEVFRTGETINATIKAMRCRASEPGSTWRYVAYPQYKAHRPRRTW